MKPCSLVRAEGRGQRAKGNERMSRILYFDCFNGARRHGLGASRRRAAAEECGRAGEPRARGAEGLGESVLRAGVSATRFIGQGAGRNAHDHGHGMRMSPTPRIQRPASASSVDDDGRSTIGRSAGTFIQHHAHRSLPNQYADRALGPVNGCAASHERAGFNVWEKRSGIHQIPVEKSSARSLCADSLSIATARCSRRMVPRDSIVSSPLNVGGGW